MMNKKRMRRQAALMTAVTAAATFGAVAYFADDARVQGTVDGGAFDLTIDTFTLTQPESGLFPVEQKDGQTEKDAIFANLDAAASGAIDLDDNAPVDAFAELSSISVESVHPTVTDLSTYNSELRFMLCETSEPTAQVQCTDPAAIAPGVEFQTVLPGSYTAFFWLADADRPQEMGVSSRLTIDFEGRTGTGTNTLPLNATTPSEPVNFGAPSMPNPEGVGDGFVVDWHTAAFTPDGPGYIIAPGTTVAGRAYMKNSAGEWTEAASPGPLHAIAVELIEDDGAEDDYFYKEIWRQEGIEVSSHGDFSFVLNTSSDNPVLLYISRSSAETGGLSPLEAMSQNILANRIDANSLEAADGVQLRESSFGVDNLDANWFVNYVGA